MVVPFSRGVSVRTGRLLALRDDSGLVIESPVISILQVGVRERAERQNSVLSAKKIIHFNVSEFRMSQSTIKFGGNFDLLCANDVKLDGTVAEEYTTSEWVLSVSLTRSSHFSVEAQGLVDIPGTVSSQFIHIVSDVSIVVSGRTWRIDSTLGMVKSQRSDCITEDLPHLPVVIIQLVNA